MGQRPSKIERKAKAIAKVARNTKPTPVLHNPVPINATLPRNPLWDSVLRAEGHERLEEAIFEFLKHHDVRALFAFIAKEHNEEPAETWGRFVLRYLDESDFKKMTRTQKSAFAGKMLQDELDLSGFRLGTALQRWQWIVQQANGLDRRDETEMTQVRNSIVAFLHDHGRRRLIDCLQAEHACEPGVREALSTILDTDKQTGESILYAIDSKHVARNNSAIATHVRDWLTGSELSFPGTRCTASKDPWAGLAGEELPKDQDTSLDSIVEAVNGVPIRWNLAYQRALRHAELYSLEDLIEALFESIAEPRRSLWMALSAEDMMRYGRRRQPAERVIAFIVDNIVFGERASRGIVQNTSNTLMVRDIKTPKTPELKKNSKRPGPIAVPPPASVKQRSGAEKRDRERVKKCSPAAQDLATVEALYHGLVKESEGRRLENVELEEMISHLLEEIINLQNQVDREAEDGKQQERDCPICGQLLGDGKSERVHMKLHQDEINEGRKKNKRSSLPGSESPSGLSKRRSKSSKGSRPSSKRDGSPKGRTTTGLSPRGRRRSSSGLNKKGRKSLSSEKSTSSAGGHGHKDDGNEAVHSTEAPDVQSTQQRPAARSAAAPHDRPMGLGIMNLDDGFVAPSPTNHQSAGRSPRSTTSGGDDRRPASRSQSGASSAGVRSPSKPRPKWEGKRRSPSRASNQASRPRSLSNPSSQPPSPRKTRSQTKASREGSKSRSPRVEPETKKRKGRALQAVIVHPTIPEDDAEGDGSDIVVGKVEMPEVTLDPVVFLSRPKKTSVGQAFVEFMRDHRESPEDAKKKSKR